MLPPGPGPLPPQMRVQAQAQAQKQPQWSSSSRSSESLEALDSEDDAGLLSESSPLEDISVVVRGEEGNSEKTEPREVLNALWIADTQSGRLIRRTTKDKTQAD